jgi:hypothetical protein
MTAGTFSQRDAPPSLVIIAEEGLNVLSRFYSYDKNIA